MDEDREAILCQVLRRTRASWTGVLKSHLYRLRPPMNTLTPPSYLPQTSIGFLLCIPPVSATHPIANTSFIPTDEARFMLTLTPRLKVLLSSDIRLPSYPGGRVTLLGENDGPRRSIGPIASKVHYYRDIPSACLCFTYLAKYLLPIFEAPNKTHFQPGFTCLFARISYPFCMHLNVIFRSLLFEATYLLASLIIIFP
jgi:hypothetical protein